MGAPWIVRFEERPAAAVRLLCLPHAGGGASAFRTWSHALPDWIEVDAVQLPGRETRVREPLRCDLAALVDELADALAPVARRPYALYGHSMGALLAFELARRLAGGMGREPVHVFVAGYGAPHLHPSRSRLHLMPFDAVVDDLRHSGVTPEPVLADHGLMALLVPILQADIAMCVRHGRTSPDPVAAPISAFAGAADTVVAPGALDDWAALTTSTFRLRVLDGGHFFPVSARAALLGALQADLTEAVTRWATPV
jgi:medium-chain acyl-[acyl-carrier-protein] hydrolase